MKNTSILLILALLIITMSSCKLDIGNGLDNPKKIEPIILKDRYDESITLTNHNDDGVDYIASDEIEVYNGTMKIEPGVTIEFSEGASINVGLEGKLEAVGTSGEPIRMIAKENNPSWAGIYINTDKSNKIHYVQLENAGEGKKYGVYNENAAAITIDGKISLENSNISKSGDVGVKINDHEASDITSFSGNTFKSCQNFPILTHFNYAGVLDLASNIYSDNGVNMIGIDDGYTDRLNVKTELEGLEIPYFIDGAFEIYANLTLKRGVELVMADNSALLHIAGDDYKFAIEGTESDHVVIRGLESENGYWQGIFINSENSGNIFDYLDISDGGGKALTHADAKANISLELEGKLEINHSTSARSGSCEILLSDFGGIQYEFVNNSPAITKVCDQ